MASKALQKNRFINFKVPAFESFHVAFLESLMLVQLIYTPATLCPMLVYQWLYVD